MPCRHLPVFLVALIMFLAGCPQESGQPEPSPPEVQPAESEVGDAHEPGVPAADLIRANADRQPDQDGLPVLHRLQEPREVERDARPNRHQPDEVDSLFVYHYDGLEIDFVRAYTGREIIRSIEITNDRYDTPQGVTIGMTRDEVHQRLGQPDETDNGADRWSIQTAEVGPEESLHVEYRDERVQRLRYGFYVD